MLMLHFCFYSTILITLITLVFSEPVEKFFSVKLAPRLFTIDRRSNGDWRRVKSFSLYDLFLFLLFLRNIFFGDLFFCRNVFVLDFLFGFGLQAFVDDFLLSCFFSNFFRNFSRQFGFVDIF